MNPDQEKIPARETNLKEGKVFYGRDPEAHIKHLEENDQTDAVEAYRRVVEIARKIQAAGGHAMLVGGSVRDELTGEASKDYDVEVFGLEPARLKELVANIGPAEEVGESFGVLKVNVGETDIDISLPRRESKTGLGHDDFAIEADPFMPPKEAARRRDFTINAFSKDILTGEIFDYFSGTEDLKNRVLRVTDAERFKDDPLRVLRGVQFIGRFGLKADDQTASLMHEMRGELKHLPKERLREEWIKLLLKSPRPSLSLMAAMDYGIFHECHPKLIAPLANTVQDEEWHPEGDVWIHTLMVVDEAKQIAARENLPQREALILMLTALCHDLGKPKTTRYNKEEGRIQALGHEAAGVAPADEFMRQIGIEDAIRQPALKLIEAHMRPSTLFTDQQKLEATGGNVSDGAIRRLARKLHPATIELLTLVAEADKQGRGAWAWKTERDEKNRPINAMDAPPYEAGAWLLERARALDVAKGAPPSVIRGEDLIQRGFQPDRLFGDVIRAADLLRDNANLSRDQILALIDDLRSKSLEEVVAALKSHDVNKQPDTQ